jgi:hypothetical protein
MRNVEEKKQEEKQHTEKSSEKLSRSEKARGDAKKRKEL